MAKDQLERFRAAVDDDTTGTEIAGLVAEPRSAGYSIGAMDELKTAPRGYAKDHPRIELLRRKGLMAWRSSGRSPRGCTRKQAVAKVREAWDGGAAVRLARHPRRSEHDPRRARCQGPA